MEENNIKTEIKALFSRMGKQEGMFEAIYRSVASKKQTVNSAVAKLVKEGMLTLTAMNENSKSKTLSLTPKGAEFANNTVNSLLNAELKAAQKFGKRKLNSLCMLRDKYLDVLQNEFIKEKLLNNSKDI
jgi:DNA-binding MarR family transcriptional regulator